MKAGLALFLCWLGSVEGIVLHAPMVQPLAISGRMAALQPAMQRAPSPLMQREKKASKKKDVLELEGVVLEALPSATFRVQLDDTEQARHPTLPAMPPTLAPLPHTSGRP